MSLKLKFIILLTVSVLSSSALIAGITAYQLKNLEKQETAAFRESMMQSKKDELKNYIDVAMSSIKDVYDNVILKFIFLPQKSGFRQGRILLCLHL